MFESYFGIGDVSSQPIMTEKEYDRMRNTAMSMENFQGVRLMKAIFDIFVFLSLIQKLAMLNISVPLNNN